MNVVRKMIIRKSAAVIPTVVPVIKAACAVTAVKTKIAANYTAAKEPEVFIFK